MPFKYELEFGGADRIAYTLMTIRNLKFGDFNVG
jgi:hypothetical protein